MTDTINIPRSELQATLDALQECRQKIAYLLGNIEWYEPAQAIDFADISIKAISARLAVDVCSKKRPDVEKAAQIVEKSAQQEEKPEPVAYVPVHPRNGPLWSMTTDAPSPERLPSYPMMSLYTAPPQREWVGLTDEEVASVLGFGEYTVGSAKVILLAIAHTVEAKLKEKNT